MAFDELAQKLFGAKRAESNAVLTDATTGTIHGTALSDSADGSVIIEVTGDVTTPDEVDIGGEPYYADAGVGIEVPTSESVKAGDEVLVSVYGEGTLRSPVVTASIGSGDRVAGMAQDAYNLADSVEGIAQQALDVANATGQHFWSDTDGAHVTEVTQEEWTDPTDPGYQSGPNSLWNSLGMLFRDGLNNLLAVLTSGLAIYDGNGNADSNVLAKFFSYVNSLGNRAARVDFFNGAGYIDYSEQVLSLNAHDPTYTGDQAQTILAMEQANSGHTSSIWLNSSAAGAAAPVFIEAFTSGLDSNQNRMEISAPTFVIGGYEGGVYLQGTYSISDVLSAIPVTLFEGTYSETVSSSVTLSESAANFSRLRIEWEAGDGYRGSTELSNPDGAHFMCVGLLAGSGTNPTTYVTWKIYQVSGNRISNWQKSGGFQRGQVNLYNSGYPTTNRNELIGITRVLGWR